MLRKSRSKAYWLTAHTLVLLGAALLGIFAVEQVDGLVARHMAMRGFSANRNWSSRRGQFSSLSLTGGDSPNELITSSEAHRAAPQRRVPGPLAILRIPNIHLEVPVFDGTDDLTLNRGVGRLLGTSYPGQAGNICIAGHRDGVFRGLKHVQVGDSVDLLLSTGQDIYAIDKISITDPSDVSVLVPRDLSSLTLITCYPFYFIGPAPRRYIIQATLKGHVQ